MNRRNYHNIASNFVAGPTLRGQQQIVQPSNTRITRSSAASEPHHAVNPSQSIMETHGTPSQQSLAPTPIIQSMQQQPTPAVQPMLQQPISALPPIQQKHEPIPTSAVEHTELQYPTIKKIEEKSPNGSSLRSFSEEELTKLKRINFKKKTSVKQKRIRQNRRLYRRLTPRNAIAALNELHGQSINETTVIQLQGNKFEAEIVINNIKFTGTGNSKIAAKNSACEKALRDLVISKFQQIRNQEASSSTICDEDGNNTEDDSTDDVPMLQLASYALHKLFAEWEEEGFEIPLPRANPDTSSASSFTEPKASVPKQPKIKTELPPNNLQMHPVMLLSVMRPCTTYSDLGSKGITPNIEHTVGATIDGLNFIASGRSKKEARKRIATEILIKLFDWQGQAGSCC